MKAITSMIVYTIIVLICILVYNICYAKLNNQKISFSWKKFIYVCIATVLIMLNNKHMVCMKMLINTIVLITELKLTFKEDIRKVINNYILMFFLLSIIEIVVTNIFLFIGILENNSSANTITFTNVILTVMVSIIEYLTISISYVRKTFKKIITFFNKQVNLSNLIYLIFITIAIIDLINVQNYTNPNSFKLILVLIIIFTILFVLVIRLKYHEEILKLTNRKLIDYNDNYSKFLDEYKIYKHNINHKLSAMKSFGNKKINALIDDLLEEETNFSIRNNEIYNIPNGIKGIVAEKLYNKEYDVLIDNKVENDPFSNLDPKTFNSISEALGIALDNAVEASEETKNPIIIMDLYEDKENLYLKVGNNYCNNIDLDELGNKYYSTKNRGSGLGLFSIKRNNLVKERIEIINSFFYIELQIKKAR